MLDAQSRPEQGAGDGIDVSSSPAAGRNRASWRSSVASVLITLAAVAVAALLGWATWQAYMGSPWTRDGTVRAYVVTMAPEVAGRIVRLPAGDNQLVHKGDVLFEIEPSDYRIALESAQAQAQRDAAALDYARANEGRQATLEGEGWVSKNIFQQSASAMRQLEAAVAVDKAGIAKAQLDLSRVVVYSPVNGYVTNLLAQLGDYANVGQRLVSLVDSDSFWIDGYFEETNLGKIQDGDPATIKLMGYKQLIRGHVGGVARGINIPNVQPDAAGLASVNPIFTWVRLAQRVPVRIRLDPVPEGVRLVAGITATVQIDPQPAAARH
ncbi:RND family efflux transporter, MFP subunit [Bradyrhizobium erythrophlei]|uniref:RND family efflux transporter, MFP subunit n=1 Tax=Bradyrhizobium erythrophlei TaxID=1437360 RepID=A0A1M5QRD5_9BRAD|nr:RND family efflux transporter, MFP subunit [Bradyrhizobium erythrophlei]